MKLLRRMYEWVLHWAETPYGPMALLLLAFAESSFFPVPPDALLIALAISIPKKAFRYASLCAVGSVVGGMFGYWIGREAWDVAGPLFFRYVPGFTDEVFQAVARKYELYNFWVVFTAGFTPIPYKVFTVAAGVFEIHFVTFLLASAIGRSARFFLVAGLIYRFGPTIRGFIDRYFNLVCFAFLVLLVLGFVAIKTLFH